MRTLHPTGTAVLLLALGCSGSEDGAGGDGGGGSGGSGSGTGGRGGSGNIGGGGNPAGGIPNVPGEPDDSVDTALPPVPRMVNVKATATADSVSITFDPIDGAADYRVYELPADEAITSTTDGHVTIQGGTYRCAGNRQTPFATMDGADQVQSGAIKTLVDGQDVRGYTRSLEEATIGYVSTVPGDGLVPVYALGDSHKDADNSCYFQRWGASRTKVYTTSTDERDELLGRAFRDDGIMFYVPSGADGTRQVYTATYADPSNNAPLARYYFTDGPEADVREGDEPAFNVFAEPADGLVPLQRVYYSNFCGTSHDELVPGMARFDRARRQGDDVPMFELHWSGLKGPTTLVVEALDVGCPIGPGLLAAKSHPAFTSEHNQPYPAWVTPDEARAESPTAELYINGQHDAANRPRPIARTFVQIQPGPQPDMDWFESFGTPNALGTFSELPCGHPMVCFQDFRSGSEEAESHFIYVETERYAMGQLFDELWVTYADVAADVNGKFRLTPTTRGRVADDSYLWVTMETNSFTTARRYPQIIVSDQLPPLQYSMLNGNSIVVQTFNDWPSIYELEVCDHRYWDVNNQCPRFDLYHVYEEDDSTAIKSLQPNKELGEAVGVDRSTRYDLYLSTRRAYLMLDGEPYGCVDLPTAGVPQAGEVSIAFGDVLYHSDADQLQYYDYMRENLQWDTQRHYDNLGFKSGVAAPEWDESRLPCTSTFAPY